MAKPSREGWFQRLLLTHNKYAHHDCATLLRDTLTRHTRLHQRDEIQGSLKLPLGHGLDDDDETSEAFTTPSGSKQVSPATSGSTAPGPVSAAVLTGGKGKKATHSRTGSIASQKSSKRAHGSKGPSSQPNSKKNTPEYKTADDDARPSATPTVTAVRSRPRRAAAAALYDENALMDDDLSSSEQDEMQEDSPNNQDHMVIPNEGKPDLHQVNSALAPAVVIGQQQQNSGHVKVEDMIKPLLPSLHTSSYLARSLEAQHNQGIPHIKSGRPTSVPATAIAGLNQPIYNFASWDQGNTYPGNNQQKSTLLANSNNPNLLGYSSSANSSGSSSGSAYNSSHSHLGSGGSASLASPYSNQTQGTPGSALGLDLGLPPTPSVPILPTPEEVQHFQGFNFPGSNSNNASCPPDSIGDQQQQQQYRLPPYSSGQQSSYETFPSFQGPNLTHHHQRASSTVSAAAAAGNFYHGSTTTTGSQGYTNQSSSPTAAQSFLARSPSGAHPPHLSQRHSASSISTSVPSGAVRSSYSTSSTPLAPMNSFSAENGMGGNYRKKAPSFVPSFWAHMTVQHQEPSTSSAATLSLNHQQHQRELYAQMQHHRSNASSRFSPTDDGFELLSNHSDTNSPVTAPSSLLAINSPTLTTGMNLYSLTSPGSEISSLPSLSSSFSSAFSGDFLRDGSIVTPSNNGVVDGGDPNVAFKHRGSFMEPLLNLNKNMGASTLEINMNAAILKAADAHTDQVSL